MSEPKRDEASSPTERPTPARTPVDPGVLREQVVAAIKTVYDPEIPVDIWELGLIYGLEIDESGNVRVEMTLTSPACPVAGTLPPEVEGTILAIDDVNTVSLELVWEPPWSMERMSEGARLHLGFM